MGKVIKHILDETGYNMENEYHDVIFNIDRLSALLNAKPRKVLKADDAGMLIDALYFLQEYHKYD